MHERLIKYLDEEDRSVTKIEELEVELEVRSFPCQGRVELMAGEQVIYPGQGANLLLDYARSSRPQYI